MSKGKVFVTDYGFPGLQQECELLNALGYEVYSTVSSTEEEIIANAGDADALLVQWAPVTAKVIAHLHKCKVIVRYGIGVDNIDLEAAKKKAIPVCNVPDYCIHEVADHTISLALALARQLTETNYRMKKGIWKIIPPHPMPAFRDMLFATVGYGRIASEVLKRSASFGFAVGAYDPNITNEQMEASGVQPLTFEELISTADIISLHLPLNEKTHHLINAETIQKMKKGTILLNTSRGGLIDTAALATALEERRIVAGLDVFESEPLPETHPLWKSEHALLTSHTAWYSSRSVPALQYLAAEEVCRGLQGEALKNRVA
ncbi:C-terminal binding protein [Chitinophaga sp. MM2321]|uniref:C-terminal binding protein n=1 Tax=Chitinophaga sp. MM2321 TaxID=3137178 RepID=UPI0032D573DB